MTRTIRDVLQPVVRGQMGLSWRQFAERAGVKYQTLWATLDRGNIPRGDLLLAIARAAEIDPGELLGLEATTADESASRTADELSDAADIVRKRLGISLEPWELAEAVSVYHRTRSGKRAEEK